MPWLRSFARLPSRPSWFRTLNQSGGASAVDKPCRVARGSWPVQAVACTVFSPFDLPPPSVVWASPW